MNAPRPRNRAGLVLLVLGTADNAVATLTHWPVAVITTLPLLVASIVASVMHHRRNGVRP